jgi:hypothetical protein
MRTSKTLTIAAVALAALANAGDPVPISLGDPGSYPAEHASALKAVVKYLESQNQSPAELRARVGPCDAKECSIAVYSKELDSAQFREHSYRGCPVTYCATMTYSKSSGAIVNTVFLR